MFGAQIFLDPPAISPSNDADVQVEQAKFWSIPIGLLSRLVLPGMKYKKGVKQRGANISKWFGRWRNELGITSPRTPFHAFRNSFETAVKNKFVGRDTLIDQIVGHEPESVGAKHYSNALLIPTKAEAINKIDYEIDLSLIIAALNGQRLAAA